MTVAGRDLKDRFAGCLLGLALGDALGREFEAESAAAIRARCANAAELFACQQGELCYTDDTEMAIGVAETLVERGRIVEPVLCRAFVANYDPSRGYGPGARAVLAAIAGGDDYGQVAEQHFAGGSFGNGAAMRVAPIGLMFRDSPRRLWTEARRSAWPTHRHELGIEGAQLLALAVALASRSKQLDRDAFFGRLLATCESNEYRTRLARAAGVRMEDQLAALGNGVEAFESVPTAIASFALTPNSFEATVANVIFLGGDTDTLAAMAGAISGAYVGAKRLPQRLARRIEDTPKGRDYLQHLAGELFTVYRRRRRNARKKRH